MTTVSGFPLNFESDPTSQRSFQPTDVKTINMAPLYAAFAANTSGHLQVSPIHSIYYEECGNANGVPIVFLHGGPGGGISDEDRCRLHPQKFLIN